MAMDLLTISDEIEGRVCCIPSSCSDKPKVGTDDTNRGCRYISASHHHRQNASNSSSGMAIRSGPHGRHAIAARDIKAGSLIVQCVPVAHAILVPPGSPVEGDDDCGKRRRCTRCFVQEGDDDASGTRKQVFGRCSKCRVAHYCSRSCQAEDWIEQHKLECQYYVKRQKRSKGMPVYATSPEEDAIPLLLRTFRALTFLRGKASAAVSEADLPRGDALVACGPRHFSGLMVSPEHNQSSTDAKASDSPAMALAVNLMKSHAIKHDPTKDGAEAMLHIWGYDRDGDNSTTDRAIRRTLNAFQKNNFGIVNALHSAIGEGVYPCAALLNHSCCPNSILRYQLGVATNSGAQQYHPPILQIVACRDISAGDELSHSYVDLALCTPERQARLWDTHGFVCECRRCQKGGCVVELPERRKEWELWPLTRERHAQEARTPRQPRPNLRKVDLDEAMSGCQGMRGNEAHIIQQSRLFQEKSNQCMVEGDAIGELHYLETATKLYLTQGKYLSPFHSQLYSVRCSYLSALLAQGHIGPAVEECERVVSALAVAFSHVQNHPLLGLQLYTLGDLYSAAATMGEGSAAEAASSSWKEKAKLAYTWAQKIMTITHGAHDPMVQTLNDNIANAVAAP